MGAPEVPRDGRRFCRDGRSGRERCHPVQAGRRGVRRRTGAFAEYVTSARAANVVLKPANVSFEQAASVPIAAITCASGPARQGALQPGQKVLVNAHRAA